MIKCFEDMRGHTLKGVIALEAEIEFILEDGSVCRLCHEQDCCENVYIESIVGNLTDIIGRPLLVAEEVSKVVEPGEVDESGTWTFYKLDTDKGGITIRWLGESNGYYSESVDFYHVEA